ncbi:MAG: glycosyltransferase [Bacteroidales bacterium]
MNTIINDPMQAIFILYSVSIGIQLFYFSFFTAVLHFTKANLKLGFQTCFSCYLCKKEFYNLKINLPLILNQDYPEFEVVVVNDVSDDETIFLLEDLEKEYSHLKVVSITQDLNFFKGKKFPLALGIKSARNECLLLTDADYAPAGPNWIKEMASNFTNEKEVVLGYGKYIEEKGFLNTVIRYETVMTAIQYFSMALVGMPYMGVGRNLAYKRSLFIQNKGFISHYNVSSGDDDLFINKVANRKNTQIEINPASFTTSPGKRRFRDWWIQKRRHLSTGKYYKAKHKLLLGTYSLSLIVLFLSLIVLLILKYDYVPVLILFALRLLSQLLIMKKSTDRLQERKLLLISPLIEIYLLGMFPVMVIANLLFKQNRWK